VRRLARPAYPAWARWPAALFVLALVPVYWRAYGPGNFLWFSDIALFAILLSLWTGWRLPYSMMAIGVLPMELFWIADFASGARLFGFTGYMFDPALPWWLRAFSLFHLAIPPLLVWMLARQGYDERALAAQTALAWIVLPASFLLTGPGENVNWVHGPDGPQDLLPPLVYLGLYMLLLPLVVYAPMHRLLRRLTAGRA
jgi:hypothetical protein